MACVTVALGSRDFCNSGAVVGMDPLQELEASLKAAKKRKAEVLAQGRAQRRNEAKRARRQATHLAKFLHEAGAQGHCPSLDTKVQAQLLMLLELANGDADVVTSFALGQGRLAPYASSGLDPHDPAVRHAIAAAVHSMHLAADDSLMLDYSYVHGKDSDILDLSRYVVEWKVFHWLLEQNCGKGVSPQRGLVREMASKFLPDQLPAHLCHRMKELFLSGGRAGRYWLVSFQQRWGVKHGFLGTGMDLEPELLEQKEPWPNRALIPCEKKLGQQPLSSRRADSKNDIFRFHFWGLFLCPVSASSLRDLLKRGHFWFQERSQKGDPRNYKFWVPWRQVFGPSGSV